MTTKTKTKADTDVSPSVALVIAGIDEGADSERLGNRSTSMIAAGIADTFRNSNERIPPITDKSSGKSVLMPKSLTDLHTTKEPSMMTNFLKSAYVHFLGEAPAPHPKNVTNVEKDPVAERKAKEMRIRRGVELACALSSHLSDATYDQRTKTWTVPFTALLKKGENLTAIRKTITLSGGTWYINSTTDAGQSLSKMRATIDRVLQCNPRRVTMKTTKNGDEKSSRGDTRDTTSDPLKATEIATRGKVAVVAAALRSMLSPDPTSGADGAVFWSDLSPEDRNALERLVLQVSTVKANGTRPEDAARKAS